jgi:hypothetical protein
MALRLLCHASSSWTADGRLLLCTDSESMLSVVETWSLDVVESSTLLANRKNVVAAERILRLRETRRDPFVSLARKWSEPQP